MNSLGLCFAVFCGQSASNIWRFRVFQARCVVGWGVSVWWAVTAETQVTFVLSNYYLASDRKIITDIATAT